MDGVYRLTQRERWARSQFATASLGDERRTQRLVKLAVQMAGNSSGTIPQQTGTLAAMKAAYRLFSSGEVTHEAICRPHWQQTRERASRLPIVFLVQDTAELNSTCTAKASVRSALAGGYRASINKTSWRWIRRCVARSV